MRARDVRRFRASLRLATARRGERAALCDSGAHHHVAQGDARVGQQRDRQRRQRHERGEFGGGDGGGDGGDAGGAVGVVGAASVAPAASGGGGLSACGGGLSACGGGDASGGGGGPSDCTRDRPRPAQRARMNADDRASRACAAHAEASGDVRQTPEPRIELM